MKYPAFITFDAGWTWTLVWAGMMASCWVEGASAPTGTTLGPVVIPKAVFTDNAAGGRDPFFPASARRTPEAASPNPVAASLQPAGLLSQIVLKGISWGKPHHLALLNNVTLAEGEKTALRLGGQTAMVRCLEIRTQSVLVTLEGTKEVREIQLRKGI